jgi:hypothetical protein
VEKVDVFFKGPAPIVIPISSDEAPDIWSLRFPIESNNIKIMILLDTIKAFWT